MNTIALKEPKLVVSVKSGLEEAMDDIRNGRMTEYESADDMFEKLG